MARKTIASLEAQLAQAKENEHRQSEMARGYFNRLAEILNIASRGKGWEDLILEVRAVRTQATTEESLARWFNGAISNENAKLWYMLRLFSKDPEAKPPHDFAMREDKIGTPNWNS